MQSAVLHSSFAVSFPRLHTPQRTVHQRVRCHNVLYMCLELVLYHFHSFQSILTLEVRRRCSFSGYPRGSAAVWQLFRLTLFFIPHSDAHFNSLFAEVIFYVVYWLTVFIGRIVCPWSNCSTSSPFPRLLAKCPPIRLLLSCLHHLVAFSCHLCL